MMVKPTNTNTKLHSSNNAVCDSCAHTPYIIGDIDRDGVVSLIDVELLRNFVLNYLFSDNGESSYNAIYDVNLDGVIDARDIVRIKKLCALAG